VTVPKREPEGISTTPSEVGHGAELAASLWQRSRLLWSFESLSAPVIEQVRGAGQSEIVPSALANEASLPTASKQRLKVPEISPAERPRPRLGLRGSSAIYRWQGVVEGVSEQGFRARLTPAPNGSEPTREIEYTDFTWEEIPDADRDLVQEDAVFYWTIARRTNDAGTRRNESLVRFRRLPPISGAHERAALEEARQLLRDLVDDSAEGESSR
jgi:hypothetical protein